MEKKELEEETQKIQGNLLMECFGFCVPEPLGEIFHQNMAIGKMFNADFADGEIKAYGKIF